MIKSQPLSGIFECFIFWRQLPSTWNLDSNFWGQKHFHDLMFAQSLPGCLSTHGACTEVGQQSNK